MHVSLSEEGSFCYFEPSIDIEGAKRRDSAVKDVPLEKPTFLKEFSVFCQLEGELLARFPNLNSSCVKNCPCWYHI